MTLGDNIQTRKRSTKTVVALKPYQRRGIIKAINWHLGERDFAISVIVRITDKLTKLAEGDPKKFIAQVKTVLTKYNLTSVVQLPDPKRKSREDYSEEYQEWFFSKALGIHGRFHWIPENRRRFIVVIAEVLLNPSLSDEQALLIVDNAVQDYMMKVS